MSRYFQWAPYVPVAERRAKAARELAKLAKKSGQTAEPVVTAGRTIASSFWGKAWCDHLEAYSDFANRLPRGRTYVRNGSVVDLRVSKGAIAARVSGSELYRIDITIRPLPTKTWEQVRKECAGKIDSILELLQGRLSAGVMQIVTRRDHGLFPAPAEIKMECSCPDSAGMCKHLAATLYGVGARLDSRPELLFLLRGVDPEELIAGISSADALRSATPSTPRTGLDDANLGDVFGIDLDVSPSASPSKPGPAPAPRPASTPAGRPKPTAKKPSPKKSPAPAAKPKVARRTKPAAKPKSPARTKARSRASG